MGSKGSVHGYLAHALARASRQWEHVAEETLHFTVDMKQKVKMVITFEGTSQRPTYSPSAPVPEPVTPSQQGNPCGNFQEDLDDFRDLTSLLSNLSVFPLRCWMDEM